MSANASSPCFASLGFMLADPDSALGVLDVLQVARSLELDRRRSDRTRAERPGWDRSKKAFLFCYLQEGCGRPALRLSFIALQGASAGECIAQRGQAKSFRPR